jgi:hypothetical protein
MIFFSGSMKLMKNESAVHVLTRMGIGDYITLLGAMEIVFTILFIFPTTMKIGFILLSCYFAGDTQQSFRTMDQYLGRFFL